MKRKPYDKLEAGFKMKELGEDPLKQKVFINTAKMMFER